ncbi:bifunctional nicotinamidase/pyrazinamidase [Pararcticibacter amylolyticus]|uniref:Nicotinamidase n=1 Tax=Pararcticibacter amylolyticus TaxID=2173175 RepID=A0A2U2PLS3_9SPHI|nr:bifunctional nicotinamidase/pyrazinamidase [Pararcticibacter amylolyticus]PWG82234.1 bifunctional nicotinamidase/pyrazinamidase [Pararcticibacter amylolyticus]
MKALLLIDIQNDFLEGGALAVPGGDAIIDIVNSFQEQFELVVATQDWHPEGHRSFASAHAGKELFEKTMLNGLEQVLWPDHCVQGTPGAEFSSRLHQNRIEAIFRKGTDPEIDSYSGFYDNGKRKSTALAEYLKGKGVAELYVAGLAADFCVYYSVKDALNEGFNTCLIENATRPIDNNAFSFVKEDIISRGGKIVSI